MSKTLISEPQACCLRKWTDKTAIPALVWAMWCQWAQVDIIILECVTELELWPLEDIFNEYECVSISLCPTWLGIPSRRKRLFSCSVHSRSYTKGSKVAEFHCPVMTLAKMSLWRWKVRWFLLLWQKAMLKQNCLHTSRAKKSHIGRLWWNRLILFSLCPRFDCPAWGVPGSWGHVLRSFPEAHGGRWWLVFGLHTANANFLAAGDGSSKTVEHWSGCSTDHEFPGGDGELTEDSLGGVCERVEQEAGAAQSPKASTLLCECDATCDPRRGWELSLSCGSKWKTQFHHKSTNKHCSLHTCQS